MFYKGEYHLFNDHNPASCRFPGGKTSGEQSHWSHAVSSDLVHWEHRPIAVFPDQHGACWSGSGIVDWNNTAGFQAGEDQDQGDRSLGEWRSVQSATASMVWASFNGYQYPLKPQTWVPTQDASTASTWQAYDQGRTRKGKRSAVASAASRTRLRPPQSIPVFTQRIRIAVPRTVQYAPFHRHLVVWHWNMYQVEWNEGALIPSKKMKKQAANGLKKRFLFSCVLVLLLLGFQETLFRVIFPIPEVWNFNRLDYSRILLTRKQDNRAALMNASFQWISDPDGAEFVHNLNLYGFRDRTPRMARRSSSARVMFVGDSFVEGFMASDDETIPNGFQQAILGAGLPAETMNFGVGAAGIPEYFRLVRDAVPLFKPSHVILVLYCNDLPPAPYDRNWLDGPLSPQYSSKLTPRFWTCLRRLFQGKPIARAWKSRPFPFIAAVPDPRNPWSSAEKSGRFRAIVAPDIAAAMQRGDFNPFLVNSYSGTKRNLRMAFNVEPHLRALKAFLSRHSAQLVVVYIPSHLQVSDAYLPVQSEYDVEKEPVSLMGGEYQVQARTVGKVCEQLGVPFVDTTPLLRDREADGSRLYWDYDTHMKGEGYLLVGKHVFQELSASGGLRACF